MQVWLVKIYACLQNEHWDVVKWSKPAEIMWRSFWWSNSAEEMASPTLCLHYLCSPLTSLQRLGT